MSIRCLMLTLPLLAIAAPTFGDGIARKPFRAEDITNTKRSYSNFNIEVTRGLYTTDAWQVYAINSHLNTVNFYDLPAVAPGTTTITPTLIGQTINDPIAIAEGPNGQVLVLGGTSHCLVMHDATTLGVIDCLMVDSEPKDLLVDRDNECCYVSCAGDDTVLRIDLSVTTMSVTDRYKIPGKRPIYMTLEEHPTYPGKNCVLVSMNISGNNTIAAYLKPSATGPEELRIWDGSDVAMFPAGGLPDEDIFRITPSMGTVDPIVSGAGAINYAMEFNPVTGDLWSLGVDMFNASPTTEQDLQGQFAANMASIIPGSALTSSFGAPVTPTTRVDIDGSPTTYSQLRSIPNPSSIVFDRSSGLAWVAAAHGPVIGVFDSAGNRLPQGRDLYLTDFASINGTNCRTLARLYGLLLAYCQDSGIIVIYNLTTTSQFPIAQLLLGHDPTPEPIQRGRAIWNDGFGRSADGRFTCATCHVGGGADGLCWDLSDKNTDEKGPMVTQTLLGIEDSAPYHWRGERTGADVNGQRVTIADFAGAFEGLLGSPVALTDAEKLDFAEFIKSLRAPANPYQDIERTIKDSLVTHDQNPDSTVVTIGDPTNGDIIYHDLTTDLEPGASCTVCHTGPTGSNGDYVSDPLLDQIGARDNFEPTQLNQLTLKKQPAVDIPINFQSSPTFRATLLGAGTRHNGDVLDLFSFSRAFFFNGTADTDDQKAADLTAFLDLFDSGTSPTVHHAVRLFDGNTSATAVTPEVTEVKQLLNGARRGWNGVVFFGSYTIGGAVTSLSWYYDASTQLFVSETGITKRFSSIRADTENSLADNVFMGVPPGNEFRIGVDWDNDGLTTGQEGTLVPPTFPLDPDSDGDGFADGNEYANGGDPSNPTVGPTDTTNPMLIGGVGGLRIEFVNASILKVQFETDEPCTWEFVLTTGNGFGPIRDARLTADTKHTAVVHNLIPSVRVTVPQRTQSYSGTLSITDLSGNTTSVNLPANWFETAQATSGGFIISDLTISNEARPTPSVWTGDLSVTIANRLTPFPFSPPPLPAQAFSDGPIPPISEPGYLVVGQLQKLVNGEWETIPAVDVTITSSNALSVSTFKAPVPGVGIPSSGVLPNYTEVAGPWIISQLTNPAGTTTMGLSLTNVPTTAATLRFVPKIIAEQTLSFPGYTFSSDPVLLGALSRVRDPSDLPTLINSGTHQFLHFGFPQTDPDLRTVRSSL